MVPGLAAHHTAVAVAGSHPAEEGTVLAVEVAGPIHQKKKKVSAYSYRTSKNIESHCRHEHNCIHQEEGMTGLRIAVFRAVGHMVVVAAALADIGRTGAAAGHTVAVRTVAGSKGEAAVVDCNQSEAAEDIATEDTDSVAGRAMTRADMVIASGGNRAVRTKEAEEQVCCRQRKSPGRAGTAETWWRWRMEG